jgi:hypothetical protein
MQLTGWISTLSKDAQSGFSTGAVIVMDKMTDIVAAIVRLSQVGTLFFFSLICAHSVLQTRVMWSVHALQRGNHMDNEHMNRFVEGHGHQ